MLPIHQQMIDTVVQYAKEEARIIGLAIGGSYITKRMDVFSDLDFIIVTTNSDYSNIMEERMSIIAKFGELLSAFSGEHVGEPRLIISLYNHPMLHVDFKFVSIEDVAKRIEDPIILYQVDSCLTNAFSNEKAMDTLPDLQWIEDRFWIWVHYASAKIGRGELFETIDFLSYLRTHVISPLILMKKGKAPRGNRYIEVEAPEYVEQLQRTVASHDANCCIQALKASIALYLELREYHATKDFVKHEQAKKAVLVYLETICKELITSEK